MRFGKLRFAEASRAGTARHFRGRGHFSTALLQLCCKAVERRKSQISELDRCFTSFWKEGAPIEGRKGCFVRRRSEAPAERAATNRQKTFGFAPTLWRCKSAGDPNAPTRSIRARPYRGEMSIREGKRAKAYAIGENARHPHRSWAERSRRIETTVAMKVNAFSSVPVSLGPQAKESGCVFASFVAVGRQKKVSPLGDGRG